LSSTIWDQNKNSIIDSWLVIKILNSTWRGTFMFTHKDTLLFIYTCHKNSTSLHFSDNTFLIKENFDTAPNGSIPSDKNFNLIFLLWLFQNRNMQNKIMVIVFFWHLFPLLGWTEYTGSSIHSASNGRMNGRVGR